MNCENNSPNDAANPEEFLSLKPLSRRVDWPFYGIFFLLLLLNIVILLTQRLYPFTDLPHHLAQATLLKHYQDQGAPFAQYFIFNLFPMTNVFYLFFCKLPVFPSVTAATKIFYALYVILLPLSVLMIIKKIGGNRWASLLSFLYIYNFSVSWGFVCYTYAVPLIIFFNLIVYYHQEHETLLTKAAIASFLLFLFFVHAQALLLALLFLGLFSLHAHWFKPKPIIADWLLAVPAVFLLMVWWFFSIEHSGESTLSYLAGYYLEGTWLTQLPNKIKHLIFMDHSGLSTSPQRYYWGLLFALPIIISFGWWFLARFRTTTRALFNKTSRPILLFTLIVLACYFFLPGNIPNQAYIYQRFSVFIMLSFIIIISLFFSRKMPGLVKIMIVFTALVYSLVWADLLVDFNAENECFTEDFLPDSSGGARLAGIISDRRYRGIGTAYLHFPNYYITWKKGIAVTSIVDFTFMTTRRNPDGPELPLNRERPEFLTPENWPYQGIEYILTRGPIPDSVKIGFMDYRKVKSGSGWTLYTLID